MIRILVVLCFVLVGAAGTQLPTVSHAQGNSVAAHACQHGGYQNLQGTDGTTFKNTGQCVSYVAHGGTLEPLASCTVISDSNGCLTLNGLTIGYYDDSSYGTISLTGAFSFSPVTGCGAYYGFPACGPAVGGGSYTVTEGTFDGGTSGTFTVSGTIYAAYFDDAGYDSVTCSQAIASGSWAVTVPVTFTDSVSGQQITTDVAGMSSAPFDTEAYVFNPNNPNDVPYDELYDSGLPGVTISC